MFLYVNIFGRPFVKRFAMLSDRCLSVLSVWLSRSSVTLVCCGQTVGWIKIKLGMQEAMAILCETGTPAPPPRKGRTHTIFGSYVVAKWLDGSRCHLVGLGPGDFVFYGDPASPPQKGTEPPPIFGLSIVAKRLNGSRWHMARRWALVQPHCA